MYLVVLVALAVLANFHASCLFLVLLMHSLIVVCRFTNPFHYCTVHRSNVLPVVLFRLLRFFYYNGFTHFCCWFFFLNPVFPFFMIIPFLRFVFNRFLLHFLCLFGVLRLLLVIPSVDPSRSPNYLCCLPSCFSRLASCAL